MNQLTISVPPELQSLIDARLAQGAYVDAGDYLRDLLRKDARVESERAWLRAMIEQGEASGVIEAEPEAGLEEIIAAIPATDD